MSKNIDELIEFEKTNKDILIKISNEFNSFDVSKKLDILGEIISDTLGDSHPWVFLVGHDKKEGFQTETLTNITKSNEIIDFVQLILLKMEEKKFKLQNNSEVLNEKV